MNKYLGYIIAALAVILAVVGVIVLPDTVVTQIGSGGVSSSHMSKYLAMCVPGTITAVLGITSARGEGQNKGKYLLVCVILLLVMAATVILNLTAFK